MACHCALGALRHLTGEMADIQRTATNASTLENIHSLGRHTFWRINRGKGIENLDMADEGAANVGFVSDGANDLAEATPCS